MRLLWIVSLFSVIFLIQSCASPASKPINPSGKNQSGNNPLPKDPLTGKIIQVKTGQALSFSNLVKAIKNHDVIYLSEKHDNPMHHAIQQRIIRELIKGGAFPVLGFEFFAMDDTPLLLNFKDSARVKHTKKMAGAMEDRMRTKLGWENQSDTMWGYYYDLLKLGRDNGLFLSGLDLSASRKKRITRKGFKGLTDLEKKQIFSTRLGDKAYENHMKALFTSVHCGMGNEKMTSRLYDTWRARNDKMALSISQLHETNLPPIIVIMGKGHTEYGLGVMDRVKALNPDISQVNIALTEINREPTDLGTYLAPLKLEGHPTLLPADYLWFTQRVSYGDPCLEFKKSLEKMGPMAPRPPGQGKKAP